MKLRYFYLLIIVASLGVSLFMVAKEGLFSQDIWVVTIPNALGRTVALVGVPAVIIGLLALGFRVFKKQLATPTHMGLYSSIWAMVVLFSLISWSYELGQASLRSTPYVYSPDGCEYSVTFPDMPRLTNGFQPGMGDYVQAQYENVGRAGEYYFLRAECVPISREIATRMGNKEILQQQIVAYAVSNGIQNPEYGYEEDALGKHVHVRGFKTIDSVPVTYKGYMYVGSRSFANLSAGGPSASYPQQGVHEFFSSLRRK